MKNPSYRQGADAIVIDSDNNYLLVQKVNYPDDKWAFPGGGVDDGEAPQTAVLRELEEELGSTKFEILHQSPITNKFEWPEKSQKQAFEKRGKWYKGQEKLQFIVRYTGTKKDLLPQEKEIKKIKWVPHKELSKHLLFDEQWENVKAVIKEYESHI